MINGYVTFEELKIITGLDNLLLEKLIREGVTLHELSYEPLDGRISRKLEQRLFNLDEVTKWISLHIY